MLNNSTISKILVVKNKAMGDAVLGLSTIEYLKTEFSNAYIDYAIPAWIHPLFEKTKNPFNQLISCDLNNISDGLALYSRLKKEKYDLIIELNQAGRTSKFFNLYQILTGTTYGYHNHHRKDQTIILDQGVRKPNIQRDLDGCYSVLKNHQLIDGKKNPSFLDYTPVLGEKSEKCGSKIVFGVVSQRETKMWPLTHFGELSQLIEKKYPEKEIIIPLSNLEKDCVLKTQIDQLGFSKNCKVVQLPLSDMPSLFSDAQIYIGNDTGIKHIAISMGVKSHTYFGPEEPLEWHPYDTGVHTYSFMSDLECRTRTSHFCGLSTCESMICLNQFKAEEIFNLLF